MGRLRSPLFLKVLRFFPGPPSLGRLVPSYIGIIKPSHGRWIVIALHAQSRIVHTLAQHLNWDWPIVKDIRLSDDHPSTDYHGDDCLKRQCLFEPSVGVHPCLAATAAALGDLSEKP